MLIIVILVRSRRPCVGRDRLRVVGVEQRRVTSILEKMPVLNILNIMVGCLLQKYVVDLRGVSVRLEDIAIHRKKYFRNISFIHKRIVLFALIGSEKSGTRRADE